MDSTNPTCLVWKICRRALYLQLDLKKTITKAFFTLYKIEYLLSRTIGNRQELFSFVSEASNISNTKAWADNVDNALRAYQDIRNQIESLKNSNSESPRLYWQKKNLMLWYHRDLQNLRTKHMSPCILSSCSHSFPHDIAVSCLHKNSMNHKIWVIHRIKHITRLNF